MAVPTFEDMMGPVLRRISDGGDYSMDELEKIVAESLGLSEDDLARRTKNGNMTQVRHRLTWTKTYLKKAGLAEYPARGMLRITEDGKDVLKARPERVDRKLLKKLEGKSTDDDDATLDPEEVIMKKHSEIEDLLKNDLLEKLRALHPRGFELAILNLCKKMDSRAEIEHTGKPGDGGVDGIVHDDKFGLSKIYVQAKRYTGQVPTGQVREFTGVISGKSKKGIFMTTADISKSAREEVRANNDVFIRLVDGSELASLMIEHNVGIAVQQRLEIKKIDMYYFEGL